MPVALAWGFAAASDFFVAEQHGNVGPDQIAQDATFKHELTHAPDIRPFAEPPMEKPTASLAIGSGRLAVG
ncbi:hypothetical protein QO002_005403 [Pararhizobium capsulatum DSM 1112]|uniref:Uncharacterized protein n=1 Tax=Pararhizobium capsulatum DSM 1112 TaxID=1121113 RepID=A0ABU0C255_9HYPH|nr:hypothetical protein [Pararhizobium capsulatum]MDQ0323197.1 hypothetical protein [Pararhizobium capsulatum DSM 1112]